MAKEGERCEMMSDSSVSSASFFSWGEREFKMLPDIMEEIAGK